MSKVTSNVPVLHNIEELEQAIKQYKANDLSGAELLSQWQAIRDAAMNLALAKAEADKVPGQDSY